MSARRLRALEIPQYQGCAFQMDGMVRRQCMSSVFFYWPKNAGLWDFIGFLSQLVIFL
jgi:hypothetical protein